MNKRPFLKISLIFIIAVTVLTSFILAKTVAEPAVKQAEQGSKALEQTGKPKVRVVYFYQNACESCDEESRFIERFNRLLGPEKDKADISISMYNTLKTGADTLLKEYFKTYKVPVEQQFEPVVFIGGKYISGDNDIEAQLKNVFMIVKDSPDSNGLQIEKPVSVWERTCSAVGANSLGSVNSATSTTDTNVVYFYVKSCNSCDKVKSFLDSLKKEYSVNHNGRNISSKLNVSRYDISSFDNLDLIKKYFEAYAVPEEYQKTPIVFIGNTYLAGEQAIKERLVSEIQNGQGLETLMPLTGVQGEAKVANGLAGYELAGIFLTGLVNGINPCSLSMVLFFISLLVLKNVNILRVGFAFILGKFVAYFALGTLFYNLLLLINDTWFKTFNLALKIALLLFIGFLAIANILDSFAAKNEKYEKIRLQLPSALRKFNHEKLKRISGIDNLKLLVPVSFVLGFLISAGELLCTGQIYLTTIIYIMKNNPVFNLQSVFYFLLYGVALIIPLVLVLFAVHKGREVFDVSEVIRGKMHVIKLLNAAIFIIFGIIILLRF